ncbi:TipC family immunity protein [Streptococcus pantholopis]|uniref:TipC family immunity protein n=1 Tax=Streptococcus pantholopis TaxID=1811193 RepID=UPI003001304E
MYQETKKTYRSHNILEDIEGFDIRGSWPSDGEYSKYTPFGRYNEKSLPNKYTEIRVGFNFERRYRTMSISFKREIGTGVEIWVFSKYIAKSKTFEKKVQIIKQGDPDKYIDKASQVKKYLADYGITAADLDRYYDEIINQKVLTDWCAIYDSNYSPADYGHVKVMTEWEKW